MSAIAVPRIDYPARMMAEAKRLREAGWTIPYIHRLLVEQFGTAPHPNTICEWTNPELRERMLLRKRDARRSVRANVNGGRIPARGTFTDEWKDARVRALRFDQPRLGVSTIARLMSWEFGESWTRHRVEKVLGVGRAGERNPTAAEGDR